MERRARKVFDSRGRHWQTVVFLRCVAPEAVREAARRRPDLPSLTLSAAAWGEFDGSVRGLKSVPEAGGGGRRPADPAAAHARLAAATRRLFAPHVLEAAQVQRAAAAAAAACGSGDERMRGGAGGSGDAPDANRARAWFTAMVRLVDGAGPGSSPGPAAPCCPGLG